MNSNSIADEENSKWEMLVDTVSNLHKHKNSDIRRQLATYANDLSKELLYTGFINRLPSTGGKQWLKMLNILSDYLDSPLETIKTAACTYFSVTLRERGFQYHEFSIEFKPKEEGLSAGCICIIKLPTEDERYYIKTYQHGSSASGAAATKPPNACEILVYKFLEYVHIAGDVHFIIGPNGSTRSLYIAMKEVKYVKLSQLNDDTVLRSLIVIDYIARIFRLTDIGSNVYNCGVNSVGQPVIIDFKVEDPSSPFISDSELVDYVNGHCGRSFIDMSYHDSMKKAVQADRLAKVAAIKDFHANLLDDLCDALDSSLTFTKAFQQKWQGKLDLHTDDLNGYIDGVKKNIIKFNAYLNEFV